MTTVEARVLAKGGGRYSVEAEGQMLEATLRGRAKSRAALQVLVGDRVTVAMAPDGGVTIEGVLPRSTVLLRRTPGRRRGVRNIAANVDQVIVVGSAERLPRDQQLMDRFLAVAAANQLPAILVINKADLVDHPASVGAPYRAAGYDVVVTSAPQRLGVGRLRDCVRDRVTLFTGPTGVGKSTLLNLIEPGLSLRTAPVSEKTRRGRHTTVAATMHPLSIGGYVVDTPGLSDVGLWGLDPKEVEAAFPELRDLATGCRFDNCRHVREPDCAVAAAAAAGSLDPGRLDSYRRLLQEALDASRFWE